MLIHALTLVAWCEIWCSHGLKLYMLYSWVIKQCGLVGVQHHSPEEHLQVVWYNAREDGLLKHTLIPWKTIITDLNTLSQYECKLVHTWGPTEKIPRWRYFIQSFLNADTHVHLHAKCSFQRSNFNQNWKVLTVLQHTLHKISQKSIHPFSSCYLCTEAQIDTEITYKHY